MEARIDLRFLKPAPTPVGAAVGPGRTIEFEWVCEGCASDRVVAEKPGTPQFAPPGRCVVLVTADRGALWVTSWPEYAQHDWRGAWVNSLFRREHGPLASDLIRGAVAATRHFLGEPPLLGMVTFIDPSKVRRKRDPGRCFRRAGFRLAGATRSGLLCLQLMPGEMPAAEPPCGTTMDLFDGAEALS